jgi:hypothetical protein
MGVIGPPHFHLRAVSGGRRESTVAGVASPSLAGRLANTKTIQHHGWCLRRSGKLRPSENRHEYVVHPPTFGECVRLQALRSAAAIHGPFAILHIVDGLGALTLHGRGRHGSDGCIVPRNHNERNRLNLVVRDGATRVILQAVRAAADSRPIMGTASSPGGWAGPFHGPRLWRIGSGEPGCAGVPILRHGLTNSAKADELRHRPLAFGWWGWARNHESGS